MEVRFEFFRRLQYGWMPELANGPGPNPGAVKRMQDRDLLHPPDAVRRDDGIGKRTRLESEGGKKNSRAVGTRSLRHLKMHYSKQHHSKQQNSVHISGI